MKKKIIIPVVFIVLISGFFYYSAQVTSNNGTEFEFTTIKRGDIENLVSCTGTLEAVGTVEVGTTFLYQIKSFNHL